jgi:hypothetical protein
LRAVFIEAPEEEGFGLRVEAGVGGFEGVLHGGGIVELVGERDVRAEGGAILRREEGLEALGEAGLVGEERIRPGGKGKRAAEAGDGPEGDGKDAGGAGLGAERGEEAGCLGAGKVAEEGEMGRHMVVLARVVGAAEAIEGALDLRGERKREDEGTGDRLHGGRLAKPDARG